MSRKEEQAESDEFAPDSLRGFVRHLQATGLSEGGELGFAPDFFEDPAPTSQSWESASLANILPGSNTNSPRSPYFFPLPYNDEQARITDSLEENGVAVVS